MSETKITLRCSKCGAMKSVTLPAAPGRYATRCPNPACGNVVKFAVADNAAAPSAVRQCPRCNSRVAIPAGYSNPTFRCPACHSINTLAPAVPSAPPAPQPGIKVAVERITVEELERRRAAKSAPAVPPRPVVPPAIPGTPRLKVIVNPDTSAQKEFPLHEGVNTVGRFDPSQPTDIAFDNDPSMSRRSVEIVMTAAAPGRYKYTLRVCRLLNPVYHNGEAVTTGRELPLALGDTVRLGDTTLHIVKV